MIKGYVIGETLWLDLGGIGPVELEIVHLEPFKVTLRYPSGKQITMSKKDIEELLC